MARLPCFLVLLFVFLGVHAALLVPASHAAPLPPKYSTSMCSESSKCGDVDIRYPFYLSNATERTIEYDGSYSCGYTDLKIFCDEKDDRPTPIIQLRQHNYTVLNIAYSSTGAGTVSLVDDDMIGVGRCLVVPHNVSFDETWLNYSSSSSSSSYSRNLTFFFGCMTLTPGHPLQPIYEEYKISCRGFENPFGGGPFSLVSATEMLNTAEEQDLAVFCRKIVTVPVKSSEIPM